jgi:ketosteroid isomerase-like protein
MNQQDNLNTVTEIYAAVGRGDVAAILDRVTDDVDWAAEASSLAAPWYGSRTGKAGVERFFGDLADHIEISAFEPHSLAAGDEHVHVLVDWTFRAHATGREASMQMHHYWRLRDGKVEHFRGSEDTEMTAGVFDADAAAGPSPAGTARAARG